MITIRRATGEDEKGILELLALLDLMSKFQPLDSFWIALDAEKIVGAVRIGEAEDHAFLSHLGVLDEYRNQDVAKRLIGEATKDISKPVYLYTIIPDYFEKLGFVKTQEPENFTYKRWFRCENCNPKACVCMKKTG